MSRLSRFSTLLVLFLLSFGLSACGGGGGASTDVPQPANPVGAAVETTLEAADYTVAAGDRLRINVFRHEDLSGEFELDGRGNFSMPLIGQVSANGLSSTELETRIEDMLKDGYLVDPQVSIEVLTYRPFYILGEVNSPGSYEYSNGMTVLNGVALAGGFTYRADQNDIILQRGSANAPKVAVSVTTAIAPGDVVTVGERYF
ncbi:MAG: polysaccharide biosynthesis/export family protein [Geminicoccaceae bacterium]|nr:polysaccharide export protein [Geminicoccaceae bacterium]